MSNEEIAYLKKTVAGGHRNSNNEIWKQAFSEFNENHTKSGARPLHMGCGACYSKVYYYHIQNPSK